MYPTLYSGGRPPAAGPDAPAMSVDSYMIGFGPEIAPSLVRTAPLSGAAPLAGPAITALATRGLKGPNRPLLCFAAAFSNAGYMGFSLIRALFGAEGLLYASIFNALFNILLWTAGIALIGRSGCTGRQKNFPRPIDNAGGWLYNNTCQTGR